MLKAIEWRTVFGFLFLSLGPLWHVIDGIDSSPVSLGLLATAVPVVIVAIIFKASGIPFRRTLTLLSLPVGFWISLVFAFSKRSCSCRSWWIITFMRVSKGSFVRIQCCLSREYYDLCINNHLSTTNFSPYSSQ